MQLKRKIIDAIEIANELLEVLEDDFLFRLGNQKCLARKKLSKFWINEWKQNANVDEVEKYESQKR